MADNEKDIVDALDALSRTSPRANSDPPLPSQPATTPRPPASTPTRRVVTVKTKSPPPARAVPIADEAPAASLNRCLACGYPLQAETAFRCSECGRQWSAELLDNWFGGAEKARFSEVLWLVRLFVVVQLCGFPEAIGLTALGYQAYRVWDLLSVGVIGWALIVSNRQRWTKTTSRYGIVACLVLGAALVFLFWSIPIENPDVQNRVLCTLLALEAPLLILALVNDPPDFFTGAAARRWLIPVAVLIGCSLSWLPLISDDWLPLPTPVAAITGASSLVLTLSVLPRLILLALWLLAWWWIRRISRTFFEPLHRKARA